MARKPRRLAIRFTSKAERDLHLIWAWNVEVYGERHADLYIAFLRGRLEAVAGDPQTGFSIPEWPGMFRASIRRRTKRHGHYAFYIVDNDGILVVRILHTAQNWPNILGEET